MANNKEVEESVVKVARVSNQAVFPQDFILYSARMVTVPSSWGITRWGEGDYYSVKVPTDLNLTVPEGTHMQLVKIPEILEKSIHVLEDVVCPCEAAPLLVTLLNFTGEEIQVKAGDPIARLDVLNPEKIKLVDTNPQVGVKRKIESVAFRKLVG